MRTQDRLLIFIKEYLELSVTAFEKKIKAGPSTVDKYLKKETDSFPSDDLWVKISKQYPKLNKKWLQVGEGEMILSGTNSVAPDNNLSSYPLESVGLEQKIKILEERNSKLVEQNYKLIEQLIETVKKLK